MAGRTNRLPGHLWGVRPWVSDVRPADAAMIAEAIPAYMMAGCKGVILSTAGQHSEDVYADIRNLVRRAGYQRPLPITKGIESHWWFPLNEEDGVSGWDIYSIRAWRAMYRYLCRPEMRGRVVLIEHENLLKRYNRGDVPINWQKLAHVLRWAMFLHRIPLQMWFIIHPPEPLVATSKMWNRPLQTALLTHLMHSAITEAPGRRARNTVLLDSHAFGRPKFLDNTELVKIYQFATQPLTHIAVGTGRTAIGHRSFVASTERAKAKPGDFWTSRNVADWIHAGTDRTIFTGTADFLAFGKELLATTKASDPPPKGSHRG